MRMSGIDSSLSPRAAGAKGEGVPENSRLTALAPQKAMTTASDRVTVSQRGNDLVARLNSPRLNEPAIAQETSDQLQSALDACPAGTQAVHLDLGDVRAIASVALNHLIGFHTKARGQGIHVAITDVQPAVREVFEITRLDRVFRVASEDDPAATTSP